MPNIKMLTKSGMKRTSSKLNCRLTADEKNSFATGVHSPSDRSWPLLSSWNVTHHKNTSLLQQSLAGSMSFAKSMAGESKITYRGKAEHCTLWQRAYRAFACSSLSLRHCLNSQTIKYPNKKKFYWMQKLCKHSIWRVQLTDSWKSSYRKSTKSTGLGRPLRKQNQIKNEIILRELNRIPRSA